MANREAMPGYEGIYEVCDDGRVLSVDRVEMRMGRWGLRPCNIKERQLRPYPVGRALDYLALRLCKDGVKTPTYVHDMVLTTFKGPRPPGAVCRHLNGNPRDNRAENLEWGTPRENMMDKHRHGTMRTGRAKSKWELPKEDEDFIRSRSMSPRDLADLYSIPIRRVYRLRPEKTD